MPFKHLEDRKKNDKKWRLTRQQRGLCACCPNKAVKSHKNCKSCAERANAAEKQRMTNPNVHKRTLLRLKIWKDNLRQQMITGYGGKCTCCGETIPEFLTLDHKKNDGALCRRRDKHKSYGPTLYLRLIKEGFPKKKFQLHCWNCNCAKGIFGGVCPHKRKVKYVASTASRTK
jgi:hypothetical protein